MEELMTLYAVSVSITFLVSLALLLGVRMVRFYSLLQTSFINIYPRIRQTMQVKTYRDELI